MGSRLCRRKGGGRGCFQSQLTVAKWTCPGGHRGKSYKAPSQVGAAAQAVAAAARGVQAVLGEQEALEARAAAGQAGPEARGEMGCRSRNTPAAGEPRDTHRVSG